MTVTTTAASGTTGTSGTARAARPASTGLGADFNTFLTLLTTQLRNQDPTNAMDVNKMTEQLVSFSGVEQQVATNTNLQQLITMQQGSQLTAASGLLGRQLEMESSNLALQNGAAALRLPAAGTASTATVQVTNGSGRVVTEQALTLGSTPGTWRWDGKDSSGRQLADGAYAFTVQGRDATGTAVTITAGMLATATGATRGTSGVNLNFGTLTLGFDRMRSVTP